MARKYFGTDGVRGKVGEYPITPDFVMKLGWAAGKVLSKKGTKKVLIGKDTRISGYMLESALEAGLSAAGLKAILMGPMPTPAVAYLTRTFRAEAGIVISASHNPFYDNGIKFSPPMAPSCPMMSSWLSKPSWITSSSVSSRPNLAKRCALMMPPVAISNSARAPSPLT